MTTKFKKGDIVKVNFKLNNKEDDIYYYAFYRSTNNTNLQFIPREHIDFNILFIGINESVNLINENGETNKYPYTVSFTFGEGEYYYIFKEDDLEFIKKEDVNKLLKTL